MHRTVLLLVLLAATPLAAQAPLPIDTLKVDVASRTATGGATRAVDVVTAREIAAGPARTVADALRWALGADVLARSPAQADLSVRGGTFEQVLVLVDGVPVSDPQTGHFDLDLAVPLTEVARIEVLRGAASALHGADALGGVVNIVSRADHRTTALVEGGSEALLRAAAGVGGSRGRIGARAAAEHHRSDGHRPGVDYEVTQARIAGDGDIGPGTLHAELAFAAADFGADGFYAPFPSYEETRTLRASLGLRGAALAPRVFVRRHEDDFVLRRGDPAFYRNVHTGTTWGAEVVTRRDVGPLAVALGAQGFADRLESTNLGERAEERAAIFAQLGAGDHGRALVDLGLRYDWHSAFDGAFSPSLSAAWWPTSALRLRGGLATAYRAPSFTERFYADPANVANPELDPERAVSVEFGADWRAAPALRFSATGFVRRAEELIDWVKPAGSTGTPWQARNIEEADYLGLELAAERHFAVGARWRAEATLLDIDAADAAGTLSKYALRPITRSVALEIDQPLADLHLGARLQHARRKDADAHTTADLRLGFTALGATAYLDVLNVWDEEFIDVTGKGAPGRTFVVGLRTSN